MAACKFWIAFLDQQPEMYTTLDDFNEKGKKVHIWGDAAGKTRWIAAVINCDGHWRWTRWRCFDKRWKDLLLRDNDQINVQELLSVVLAVKTFENDLRGRLWFHWCDNDGITHTMVHGSATSGDINNIAGKMLLDIANLRAGINIERVESAANIADGPTRDFMVQVNRLEAQEIPPVMPQWIDNIWQPILSLVV